MSLNFINYFLLGEKKITSTVKPTMSYTNAIISSSDPVANKPIQQPPPPAPPKVVQSVSVSPATTASIVTVSVTPTTTGSISVPSLTTVITKSTTALPLAQPKSHQEPSVPHHPVAIVSPMVSSAPPPPQPQIKPQVVDASEYSLFDSFSKVHYNILILFICSVKMYIFV